MKKFLLIILIIVSFVACSSDDLSDKNISKNKENIKNTQTISREEIDKILSGENYLSIEDFCKKYDISVIGQRYAYDLKIPQDWSVYIEDYPIGLYWEIANVFSKEIGLDLELFKGQDVKVIVQKLKTGLQNKYAINFDGEEVLDYLYESNVTIIEKNGKVIGGYYNFNTSNIGPSLNKKSFKEITGQNVYKYIDMNDLIKISEENKDLINMSEEEVIREFFDAINKKNKKRAYACLGYKNIIYSLTMNKDIMEPFNKSYSHDNSIVENILDSKVLSIKESNFEKKENIKTYNVDLYIKWAMDDFNNPPSYEETRFIELEKYDKGWKIEGINTG